MKKILLALSLAFALPLTAGAVTTVTDAVSVLSWNDVKKLPLPPAGIRSVYGPAPQQFGELRLPHRGKGPFPVVVLVHGGCWLKDFDYQYITRLAEALTGMGVAVWTPEYRRLGDAGGGWPNTFLDVAQATDHLRVLINEHPLDLGRVVTMGHSAGGQLALWLAARHKLPKDSALFLKHPMPIKGVIGLAAITDMRGYRVGPPNSCNASVDQLLGTPEQNPKRYSRVSPMELLPLGVPQWLVQGERDTIVPPEPLRKYVETAQTNGDKVKLLLQPTAGHFEPAQPETISWDDVRSALNEALDGVLFQ